MCPVESCNTPFAGWAKSTLPRNWLANHFFDQKQPHPARMCQSCSEDGRHQEATQWCESCSKASQAFEYFCDTCFDSEHATKTAQDHIHIPVDKMLPLPECPKHKQPMNSFCFDEKKFVCSRCHHEENHVPSHKTKLIGEIEKDVKNDLRSVVGHLRDEQV